MEKKKLIIAAALAAAISLTVIIVVFAGGNKKDGDRIQNVSVAAVKEPKASSEKESTKKFLLAENEEAKGDETGETAEGESDSKEEETSKGADNATDAASVTKTTDKISNSSSGTEANTKNQSTDAQSQTTAKNQSTPNQQTEKATNKTASTQKPTTAASTGAKPQPAQPQTQAPTQPATQKATQPSQPQTQAPKPTEPATTAHTHNWQAHYATRTVSEAWDEPVYQEYDVWEMHEIHTCNGNHKDGVDLTEARNRYLADHPGAALYEFYDNQIGYVTPCGTDPIFGTMYPGGNYLTQGVIVGKDKIQVNTIHHDAVTEQYVDYYTCACGATK